MAESYPAGIPSHLLPANIRRLVELIGLSATLKLMEVYGGAYCYVPKPADLSADHALVQLLGIEAAQALAREVQGDRLRLARGCAAVRAVRDAAIVHDYYVLHQSQVALARKYRLDERTVRAIVNRTALPMAQADLFG